MQGNRQDDSIAGHGELQTTGKLTDRQVTRKEFLAILGSGLAVLIGIDRILHLFSGGNFMGSAKDGYGSGPYGGPHDHPRKITALARNRRIV